ncbi:MAG: NUDIX hydrolase [Croceitalea sp.]|nr:hypothetical protein [Croceitalea sp.]NNM18581.1 NUDIX hydrolase [Croceitalea sp.]
MKTNKTKLLILLLLLQATTFFAQESEHNNDVQRLIIINESNEVLMEHNEDGWMTPALIRHQNQSVQEGLDSLANTYGLKIAPPSLRGLYTFEFTSREKTSINSHYKVAHVSGDLSVPADKLDAKWVSMAEAKRLMNLPSFKAIPSIRQMTGLIFDELDSY